MSVEAMSLEGVLNQRNHWQQFRDQKIQELVQAGLKRPLARKLVTAEIRARKRLQAIAGLGVATIAHFDVRVEDGRIKPRFVINPSLLPAKERGRLAHVMQDRARYEFM